MTNVPAAHSRRQCSPECGSLLKAQLRATLEGARPHLTGMYRFRPRPPISFSSVPASPNPFELREPCGFSQPKSSLPQ